MQEHDNEDPAKENDTAQLLAPALDRLYLDVQHQDNLLKRLLQRIERALRHFQEGKGHDEAS